MAQPKLSGLGKGLDALFFETSAQESNDSVVTIRTALIEPNPNQPRKNFDEAALAELAASIEANGLLQPILVREIRNGFYRIIAGERRWRACKMANLTEIPCLVRNDLDDRQVAEVALIENIQRRDLNAIEEAEAYRALIAEFGLTQEEVANKVGVSRSAVANTLRLLDLPDDVAAFVAEGLLSAGHARTLLGLQLRADIPAAAETVLSRELSVRATEELVKEMNRAAEAAAQGKTNDSEPKRTTTDYLALLTRKMTERLGRRVQIAGTKKNPKLVLSYTDNDDLQTLVELLCGKDVMDL